MVGIGILGLLILLPLPMLLLTGQWKVLGVAMLLLLLGSVFLFGTVRGGAHEARAVDAPRAQAVPQLK